MAKLSSEATAEMARRKAASRARALHELRKVVAHRGGEITGSQLGMIASLLSWTMPAADLPAALMGWLNQARANPQAAYAFYASFAWADILGRAQAAELGEGDNRADPSVERLRDEFKIDDAYHATLGLTLLVSDALRQRLASVAEGAAPGAVGRPRGERPWEAAGVSKATWHRGLARHKRAAEEAQARRIAGEAGGETKFDPIGNGTPTNIYISNRVEFRLTEPLPAYEAYEPPPSVVPTPRTAPLYNSLAAWSQIHDTAEARRLAALAQRLGLIRADMPSPPHPDSWWILPQGRTPLSAEQEADLAVAFVAAQRGQQRQEGIRHKRARLAQAAEDGLPAEERAALRRKRIADERASDAAQQEAFEPGDRPARISQAIWDAVPHHMRRAVRRLAGHHALCGWTPDAAVECAVVEVRQKEAFETERQHRVQAIVAAVLAADQTADLERVLDKAGHRWEMATMEAVPLVIAAVESARGDSTPPAEPAAADPASSDMSAEFDFIRAQQARRAIDAEPSVAAEIAAHEPPIPEQMWEQVHRAAIDVIRKGAPKAGAVEYALAKLRRRP